MIDANKLSYTFILLTPDNKQYDITPMVQDGGWEEGKGEFAVRINGTMCNGMYKKKRISSIIKIGCMVRILASHGGKKTEVARGTIIDWGVSRNRARNDFSFSAYDDLYFFQESQDNYYFTKGTKTKTAFSKIFSDWKIPMDKYQGPNVEHAKMAFKNDTLSNIVLDILEEAGTKNKDKYLIRSVKGKVQILPRGSNKDVYHFGNSNLETKDFKQSISGMITRVKIIGQEDKDGKSNVVDVLDGDTKVGIRQKIITNSKSESKEDAQKEAEKILEEQGKPEKRITLEGPDVPYLRKGDKVHVKTEYVNGYFYITSIRHDCSKASMSMEVERV